MNGGVTGMSKKASKTNAARILDTLNLSYKIISYDSSSLSAIDVANKSGIDVARVYKTIVCVTDSKEHIVACIRGDETLNLKVLAREANAKNVELLDLNSLEKVTGYIRGGCSPIGMKKEFRLFLDLEAFDNDTILVSAGIRGKQLEISPNDLKMATNAKICKISMKG